MAVAAGLEDTIIVSEDGNIFSIGRNNYGQLGTGDKASRLAPVRVAGIPAPVRQVAAGGTHTGIVTDAGDLLMCGDGGYGQLGLGNEDDRTTPTLVERALLDGEAVLMVACGVAHTAVATEGGGVYTFGRGFHGQLGHGDDEEEDWLAPRRVPAAGFNAERVVMVAAGDGHTVALSEAGHVFTWGFGLSGQLGHNDRKHQRAPRQVEAGRFGGEKVVFVAAGGAHTAAVTEGGRLYTWGAGGNGRLGHGDTFSKLVPTVVGVEAFGAREGGRVVMSACGKFHTLVVTQDGALWACGRARWGQLGIDDMEDSHVFERVGVEAFGGARVMAAAAGLQHSVAVTQDGALWTWGGGAHGKLGHGDLENRLVPTRVTAAAFDTTRAGRFHSTKEHTLAFFMSQHDRLGGHSVARNLKPELLDMIVRMNTAKPGNDAISRLLGFSRVRTCKYCVLSAQGPRVSESRAFPTWCAPIQPLVVEDSKSWLGDWATGKRARLKKLNNLWNSISDDCTGMLKRIIQSVEDSKAKTPDGRKIMATQINREKMLYEIENVNTLDSDRFGLAQADYAWKKEKWEEVFKTDAMQEFCKEQAYKIAQLYTMEYYGQDIVAYDVLFERMQPIFKKELTVGLSKIKDACEHTDTTKPYPEQWLSQVAVSNEFYYAFDQHSLHSLLTEIEFLTHSEGDQQQILYRMKELLAKENIDGSTVLSEICDFLHDKL